MADTAKNIEATPSKREISPATTSLRAYDPFAEIDRLFEDFAPWGRARPSRLGLWNWPTSSALEARVPRVDVIERENDLLVRAELPGVEKDKLDISLTDDSVTIKATTAHEEKEEKGDYYRCEITRGAFARTLPLPAAVNTEKAKATFKDGILELTLPRREQAKRRAVKVE